MSSEICWTFSVGSDAWSETESRVMARYSREVLGPSDLSGREALSLWNAEVRVLRLCAGGDEGGVTIRKSSRSLLRSSRVLQIRSQNTLYKCTVK